MFADYFCVPCNDNNNIQEHLKGIVKGSVPCVNRDIAFSGGLKAVESLKTTAMGQAINRYTDEEVLVTFCFSCM